MTTPLYVLIYVSTATNLFTKDALRMLLAQCHKNNGPLGLTGMLLYKDGNFMQVLEGSPEAVAAMHERIRRDPRHYGLVTLLEGPLKERNFAEWTMGFRDLESAETRALPGYSEFLNAPLTGKEFSENPSLAQKLLLSFKKSM